MSSISYRGALILSFLSAAALLFSSASYAQRREPDPNVIKIVFSATDYYGNSITTLAQPDIRVFDDGKPQTITSFERITGQPFAVAVLVDTSVSQGRLAETAKLAARTFVENVMRSGKDQIGIISFADTARVEQELTTDKPAVLRAIEQVRFATPASVGTASILESQKHPDGLAQASSADWDTVWEVSERVSLFSTRGSRRAILLLSDGEDTDSRYEIRDAIERAQRYDVAVYAVGMGDKKFAGIRQSLLEKIAEETGGRAFFPRQIEELQGIFAQLGQELSSPYVVKYTRTNRKPHGEIQKLKLQLTNSRLQELTLNYRRGYVAP